MRESFFSREFVDLSGVLQYSLEQLETAKIYPDLIVSLEATFPFREKNLLDNMILKLVERGLDSIVAAKKENRAIWKEKEREIIQLDEGLTPRQFKDPTFLELRGVGCVTRPQFLREGVLFGNNMGIYEIVDPFSPIEVRTEREFKLASLLSQSYFQNDPSKL